MNAIPERRGPEDRVERAPRTVTMLIVAKLVTQGREGLCRIRNIGPGGLTLETATSLEPGQRLAVEIRDKPALHGRCAWRNAPRAGMAFDTPVEVKDVLGHAEAPESKLRRVRHARGPRVAVGRHIGIDLPAGSVFGDLVDISQGGARLSLPVRVDPGEWIMLDLPGLKRKKAVVRWIEGQVGVAFADRLGFEELSAWLAGLSR